MATRGVDHSAVGVGESINDHSRVGVDRDDNSALTEGRNPTLYPS